MKNKSTWHQCGSKHRYRYEHDAEQARKKYELMRGEKLRVYACGVCNGFHLTHTSLICSSYVISKRDYPCAG